ncbi:ATP-binding protein, partial [Paenibacillus xylanexedens]|uniref:ATP-binding protein n=1 Tax=Paenibacillus xylanexedens TaxID=528191 RepID=UPI0028E4C9D4
MEVMLPDNFNRDTMYRFISKIIGFDKRPISHTFDFDFSNLKFISPVGVTVLSNFHEWLVRRDVTVRYKLPPLEDWDNRKALSYLDDSLYFEQHIGEKRRPNANPRETTQPLTFVEMDESYQWFEKIINWLSIRLKVSRSSLAGLKMCLQEIFMNIKDHSNESLGCAFIQHFPYQNTVTIAISDFGVGIPHTISKTQPSLNDAQCIVKATE